MPGSDRHKLTARRLLEYSGSVVLGNGVYFLCFYPHLPATLRHETYHIDWGLGLDFLTCAAVYGLIKLRRRI